MSDLVPLPRIEEARSRIGIGAIPTPLIPFKSGFHGIRVFLKAESLQRGGSFKIRGATNKIRHHEKEARARGVITYSSGNHAQGVALAASDCGVRAIVVTLDQAAKHKIEGARRYGAEVIFGGRTSLAIREHAETLARESGFLVVPPFDDDEVIAGQGTVGLEILEQLPPVGTVLVPVGGGGLLSGIAAAIRSSRPEVRIIGVEPQGAAAARASREAGEVVVLERVETIADGLKPVSICRRTFAHMQRLVDDLVIVTDEQILETARLLLHREKLIVEPSGAAALAALLHGIVEPRPDPVVAVLSGGNADLSLLLG